MQESQDKPPLLSSQVRGKTVVARGGRHVGEVRDVVVDPTSWHVDGLLVRLGKEIAKELSVERDVVLKSAHVEGIGDFVSLKETLDQIRSEMSGPTGFGTGAGGP